MPAGLVLELYFLVRCTVEVARGTGRRRKKGWSRGFTLMEPWLLQPRWFMVETTGACRSIFLRVELADMGTVEPV